jgi:Putative DNA-binding domain
MMDSIEALHQAAFLQAVFGQSDCIAGAAQPLDVGLASYRNNSSLNASRAMSLMFPAVYALLGEEDFYPLARLHWLAQPPQRGDWSQYGADFGVWIADNNPGGVLNALPFLPDLARLDDALSRCQDAANATADLGTLALLEQDPATLRIVMHPSVGVLDSAYDVTSYRAALLQDSAPELDPEPEHVRRVACVTVIARLDWRATATPIKAGDAAFVRQCLVGATVLQAHDAATAIDAHFDAAQWLSQAIPAQWLLRVENVKAF